jgi:hypothetical protein
MKFWGLMQHHEVSILIDSGSSISFISESLAQQLSDNNAVHNSAAVQIAGGGILHSLVVLKQVQWEVSPYVFHTDLRVLPLAAYDVIIGMDWLESHNPMQVHWKLKWMEVPYQGQQIRLQGEVSDIPTQLLLQVCCLTQEAVMDPTVFLLPVEIQSLIDQFGVIFEEPDRMPPSRDCNHEIPLVPGARTVNVRPYRYPPALKDEIENQVSEMLAKAIIQHSSSLFSSPVLLVKK